jgi:hypothetical protein
MRNGSSAGTSIAVSNPCKRTCDWIAAENKVLWSAPFNYTKGHAMKLSKVGILAVSSLSVLFAASAAQADTQVVTVNAQIIGICKYNTGQSPVVTVANTGATIDPSLAGPATGSANVLYKCTNGTTPVFTGPATATVTCTTAGTCGATTMAPAMTYVTGGNGAGFSGGKDKTLVVDGQLTQVQYQDMQSGTYSGTVTVTVTP